MRNPLGTSGTTSGTSVLRGLAGLLGLVMLAAACGTGGNSSGGGDGLTGSINISGSSTVEPISIAVAEKFSELEPGVNVTVTGPGTGDGFEAFCAGETDISDASRPISDAEEAACEDAGIEYVEIKVANDGIAVLTSPANDQVGDCLSFTDIYSLVGPESQGFDSWSAANSLASSIGDAEAAPFPDVPLAITGPGEESGTYDSFVEIVLEDIAEEREQDPQTRPDYQASSDDNVIIQGIEGSDTSFGWVGFAFYANERDALKAFEVAGEDGACVAPTPESIADNSYPISRPLFIYVNRESLDSNPALEAFVELYVSDDGLDSAEEVGYVNLDAEGREAARAAFESRTTGSQT